MPILAALMTTSNMSIESQEIPGQAEPAAACTMPSPDKQQKKRRGRDNLRQTAQ